MICHVGFVSPILPQGSFELQDWLYVSTVFVLLQSHEAMTIDRGGAIIVTSQKGFPMGKMQFFFSTLADVTHCN